jgi:Tfp pilus assembly protein PilF
VVLRQIGQGGMGRVFAAHDRKLQREVALKVSSSAAPTADALARFRKEALAVGALSHPNIVAIHDVGEQDGQPFLVTELLRGAPLRELLRAGPVPLAKALHIGAQVARGLQAAHDLRIVHRDLKPENIFVDQDGWTKILDFGLAKLIEEPHGETVSEASPDWEQSRSGRIVGTAGYMSPEQLRAQSVTGSADLFVLGAVLFEMFTGRRAFEGASAVEVGYAVLHREPELLQSALPPELKAVIATCLEKSPARRTLTARQVAEQLELLRHGTQPEGSAVKQRGGSRRRKVALGVACVLAAGVLGGSAWQLRLPRSQPRKISALAGTVAVLPFQTVDGAPSLLGEDLVLLLSRDVTLPTLRTAPTSSVIRSAAVTQGVGEQRLRAIAESVGAELFVSGTVRGKPEDLVIHAELRGRDTIRPLAEADVEGNQRELQTLADQLDAQLGLQGELKKEEPAQRPPARQLTAYPEALAAYLEGERLLRHGRYSDVSAAFQRAIAIDQEFALAQYRLAATCDWKEPGLARDALERALQHPERLTPIERLLAQARLANEDGLFDKAEKLLRELVRAHPEAPEAWLQLAELYFHSNPARARPITEALEPLQQTVLLDPFESSATEHLLDLAQLRDEPAVIVALSDRFLGRSDPDPLATFAIQLLRAVESGDSQGRAAQLARAAESGTDPIELATGYLRTMWQGDYAEAELLGRLMAGKPAQLTQSRGQTYLGAIALARAQPASARIFFAKAEALDANGEAAVYRPWMDTLDWVQSSPDDLREAIAAASRLRPENNPALGPERAWLLGALAIRLGDRPRALEMAAELERMPPLDQTSITSDLALSLRARTADADGHAAEALALLEQQQHRISLRYLYPFAKFSEAFLRGRLLAKLGRNEEALHAYDSVYFNHLVEPALLPIALLRKAQARESAGDAAGAAALFARVSEMWRDAEPSMQPLVREAHAKMPKR